MFIFGFITDMLVVGLLFMMFDNNGDGDDDDDDDDDDLRMCIVCNTMDFRLLGKCEDYRL
jgi:hypothetical protein